MRLEYGVEEVRDVINDIAGGPFVDETEVRRVITFSVDKETDYSTDIGVTGRFTLKSIVGPSQARLILQYHTDSAGTIWLFDINLTTGQIRGRNIIEEPTIKQAVEKELIARRVADTPHKDVLDI